MIKENLKTKKWLYFDCYSGISGDMTLGALIDLGVDFMALQDMLAGLKVSGYKLEREKVIRGGISGTRVLVKLDDSPPVERHLSTILRLIDDSDLPGAVQEKSFSVFRCLAEAEASVHGIAVEKVHFHEVGAVDAIVDIVGVSAALYLLQADMITCSPLPLGRGEVQTAHGRLPLPAPATLELLSKRQVPLKGSTSDFEMVTPTGAAIVTALADSFGSIPSFNLEAVGYGAGSFDPGYPNFLRLLLGSSLADGESFEEEVAIIETNIDDQNPELFGYLMEKCFQAGALDLYFTAVQMKKNRPGVKLTILSLPEKAKQLQDLVFAETTTLGFRLTTARKVMRPREATTVETEWGPVRIKYSPSSGGGRPLDYAPEYEDCRAIAERTGLPLKEVYRIVEHLFRSA